MLIIVVDIKTNTYFWEVLMKKFFFLILLTSTFTFAQTTAEEILDTVIDSQRGGQTVSMEVIMTVVRPDKDDQEYAIESVGDGEERSLILVVAPSRDAGTAFLQDGDNLYLYNSRLKRVLRLPPSGRNDSFLGSDVSYNDLSGRDLEEDYTAEITAEDDSTIELTLIPTELAPVPYGKIVLTVDKQNNYRPLNYLYYDQREQTVREIIFSDYIESEDIFMPTNIEIINLLKEGEKTVAVMENVKFGVDVNEDCFSQRALERGCN